MSFYEWIVCYTPFLESMYDTHILNQTPKSPMTCGASPCEQTKLWVLKKYPNIKPEHVQTLQRPCKNPKEFHTQTNLPKYVDNMKWIF